MTELEGGLPWSQRAEDEEEASPEHHALLAHGMHGQGDPLFHNTSTNRGPPKKSAPQAHGVQGGGGRMGQDPSQKGRGGHPLSSCARHSCAV